MVQIKSYNYLRAIWRNNDHLTYGGNGYGGGLGATADSSNYMLSGQAYGNGWNETASGNMPDDRRFISSSGPFYLPAHGKASLDFAYVFTRNESGPNGSSTSIATNLHDVMRVKHWFETDSFPCAMKVGITETNQETNLLTLYPVPANESVTIQSSTYWNHAHLELYDVLGNKIYSFDYPANQLKYSISTENLSKGLYFIKLFNETNSIIKKLVIHDYR